MRAHEHRLGRGPGRAPSRSRAPVTRPEAAAFGRRRPTLQGLGQRQMHQPVHRGLRTAGACPGSSETTVEGTIWPVDANLRPEGRNGPLVRTLVQPPRLLPALGQDLGVPGAAQGPAGRRRPRRSARSTSTPSRPLVWQAAERENFVARRAEDAPPRRRQHPRRRGRPRAQARPRRAAGRRVRRPAAPARARPQRRLPAQRHHPRRPAGARRGRLRRAGRTPPQLDDAYRFLRAMEHRIQLYRLRRTHLVPEDEADLRRLGRSLGPAHRPGRRAEPASGGGTPPSCGGCTRSSSTGRCSTPSPSSRPARPGSARRRRGQRLEALGYADPAAALRHLEALASGVTPQGRDPADAAAGAARLVRRLRRPGRRAARLPQGVRRARQDALVPAAAARRGRRRREPRPRAVRRPARPRPAAARPRGGRAARRPARGCDPARPGPSGAGGARRRRAAPTTAEGAVAAARGVRRRELFRTAAADIVGSYGTEEQPGRGGPRARSSTGSAARSPTSTPATHRGRAARRRARAVGRHAAHPVRGHRHGPLRRPRAGLRLRRRRAVRARAARGRRRAGGRAGREHRRHRDAPAAPAAHAPTRRCSSTPTCAPRARPGRWCARSTSYAAYYRRWSLVWESQALLRAEPVAGRRGPRARASSS